MTPSPLPGAGLRAILLDALGTLLELEPPAPLLRSELAKRFDLVVAEDIAEHAIAAEIAFYRGHLDEGRDPPSLAELRHRCAQALREALPEDARRSLPPAGELVAPLLASLRFRVYPEVEQALAAWRARGLRLVVVSNWDVSLHEVLRNLGLASMLDGAVTSAEVGQRKPSPVIFERALRLAAVDPGEAIHVGDSLEEDVVGATGAGIEAVLVRRDGRPARRGTRTVVSLAELAV